MKAPDILLIVLDTLRADRLSCYGHPATTTPNLDAFAQQGVLFERALSPAQWTIPAHGSLFTGQFPSTHGTTQIFDKHSREQRTLAEHLGALGYRTAGFCNNPLLGVIQNDLDRGFQEFYNYGGVLPTRPPLPGRRPHLLRRLWDRLRGQLGRLADPIQQLFAHNEAVLRVALHPWLVPLWERNINFKGNTRQSIHDLVGYLKRHHQREDAEPLLVYLNLMETHLPFSTPVAFSREFAPTFHQQREARAWMQSFNHRTFDWIRPIETPFSPMQHQVLNEMYNAEVAYEDHLLRHLLDYLDQPEVKEKTLVIITSDHGEGLDHHGYVGHSLVVYEDLLRVPLLIRYPARADGSAATAPGLRVRRPTSTRRIFHTILEAAGLDTPATAPEGVDAGEVHDLSLRQASDEMDPGEDGVFAEAYPPLTLVRLIEAHNPEAVATHRCRSTRRALYAEDRKLIAVDDTVEELYDVAADPGELDNLIGAQPQAAARLEDRLRVALAAAVARRPQGMAAPSHIDVENSGQVSERLRRLGYIE